MFYNRVDTSFTFMHRFYALPFYVSTVASSETVQLSSGEVRCSAGSVLGHVLTFMKGEDEYLPAC